MAVNHYLHVSACWKDRGYKSMHAQCLHFLKELLCHQVHKFSGLERLAEVKAEAGKGGTDPGVCLLEIS